MSLLFSGGTVGGLTAAYTSQGNFKSVASVIRNDLTPTQRQRLADTVMVCIFALVPVAM